MKKINKNSEKKYHLKWWQKTSIYEIWPRSYMDSNNDGIGDIKGIILKLDYIKDLGFETIWIAPFFSSPVNDNGYDISDYCSINPDFGTMNDVIELISQVHKRKMFIIFDMVMNHTSIEHPWFKESRSGRDNPKRNWYLWRNGNGKKPPNNWMSMVGTKGWQYDKNTGQWFYTSFLPFQPDLNYHNPDVKKAMFDNVRFWLSKGVDGFRLDIFNCIYKDEHFKDNPFSFKYFPSPEALDECFFQKKIYNLNHPKSFNLARELRKVINEFKPERFVVGEVSGIDEMIRGYLGEKQDGLNAIFLFESVVYKWNAAFFRELLEKHNTQYPYPYVPTYVYSNHDIKRGIMRIKGDQQKAKLLAMFQITARGIPVVYYGEEIGMVDGDFPLKGALDPIARMYAWAPKWLINLLGLNIARDDFKTPMQWDNSVNAGFTGAASKPWLPVNKDYKEKNVAAQLKDNQSLLNVFKKLLKFRKTSIAILEGGIKVIHDAGMPEDLLAYTRSYDNEKVLVLINFGKNEVVFSNTTDCTKIAFSTGNETDLTEIYKIKLEPFSGMILTNKK